MYVVKLSDRSDTAERHFKKSHARGVVNIFGRQASRRAVHHLAPSPERSVRARAPLRAPANHALKCVRVCIDHAGQHRLTAEASRVGLALRLTLHAGNVALPVAKNRHAALEAPIRVEQIRKPSYFLISMKAQFEPLRLTTSQVRKGGLPPPSVVILAPFSEPQQLVLASVRHQATTNLYQQREAHSLQGKMRGN